MKKRLNFTFVFLIVFAVYTAAGYGSTETVRLRVVDFSFDYALMPDNVETMTHSDKNRWLDYFDIEVDGDTNTADWIQTVPFSLTTPRSPREAFWNDAPPCSRWYGGFSFEYANRQSGGITEHYVNINEIHYYSKPWDNWALHMFNSKSDSPYRASASWIWKKEDFTDSASNANATVCFSSDSIIALYCQRYWGGYDGKRFVVQDGDDLYISETLPEMWVPEDSYGHYVVTNPNTSVQWALWTPAEGSWQMRFTNSGGFGAHTFTNVQAIGWYVYKDTFDPNVARVKWEGFECYADVTRPVTISANLEMAAIPAGTVDSIAVTNFYISDHEISYDKWRNQREWAYNTKAILDRSLCFTFDRDGDMGSMDYGYTNHIHTEPVTDITLRDAMIYCNSLSLREGLTPVYYTDTNFVSSNVYQFILQSPAYIDASYHTTPVLYVNWDADGYRLPTEAEWKLASDGQTPDTANAWIDANSLGQTQPLGGKTANANGLYDMMGNVWELTWTFGDSLNTNDPAITVWGGGLNYDGTANHLADYGSDYGDLPYDGNWNIGLRVVRRKSGLGTPGMSTPTDPANIRWTIAATDISATNPVPPATSGLVEMITIPAGTLDYATEISSNVTMQSYEMGKYEVTYRQWKKVYDWAIAHGYTFDKDGDMGSMDWKDYVASHSPDEPVTDIAWHDMATWCNALSVMEGRSPVHYLTTNRVSVYTNTVRWRSAFLRWMDRAIEDPDLYRITTRDPMMPGWVLGAQWNANGYRVPTMAEYEYAYQANGTGVYPWGADFGDETTGIGQYAWYLDNANDRTHPIGQKSANAFGLYDMAGNIMEMLMDMGEASGPIGLSAPEFSFQTNMPIGSKSTQLLPKDREFRSGNWRSAGFPHHKENKFSGYLDGDKYSQNGGGMGAIYPHLGFRVMRAATDTYPADGRPADYKTYDAYPALSDKIASISYDQLDGQCYRYNLKRDAMFPYTGITNSENLALKWKVSLNGAVQSSPVIVSDVVYIGSLDSNVYAVDADSGEILWNYQTDGPVRSSACIYSNTVFIGSDDGKLYALNKADGSLNWSVAVGDKDSYIQGSPAVAFGIVFVGAGNSVDFGSIKMTSGMVYGYDIDTGAQVWKTISGNSPQGFGSVAILDNVMAWMGHTVFCSYDLSTGDKYYSMPSRYNSKGWATVCMKSTNELYMISPVAGGIECHNPTDTGLNGFEWSTYGWPDQTDFFAGGTFGHEGFAAPVAVGNRVYLPCVDGNIYTFYTDHGLTGQIPGTNQTIRSWQATSGYGTNSTEGAFRSAPAYANGNLYLGCDDGRVFSFNAETGATNWTYQTGSRIWSSPWILDNRVYIGSDDGYLYCLHDASPASSDADNDGLPDWWETQYYGGPTNANPNAMGANGVNTVMEAYIAGLNPTNPASLFVITDFESDLQNVIYWPGVNGRVYTVYWSSNLLGGFDLLESNVPWTCNSFTDTIHTTEGKGFYKIDVQLNK